MRNLHRYNNKYGYATVLRRFCAVPESLPVWGEIQHSLFLNTRYFTSDGQIGPPREQLQRFPRLLSWNTLLPFPHQVPIGDPLWYFLAREDSTTWPQVSEGPHPPVVVMPKLNDEVEFSERLSHYEMVTREAGEKHPGLPLIVSLHPREARHREEIDRSLGDVAHLLWREGQDHLSDLRWSLALISQAQAVVSDYFGAHAFRATAFFGTPVTLIGGSSLDNPGFHETMRPRLFDFLDADGDVRSQREIAEQLLGKSHQRPVDELTNIMGFTGVKKILGRPVRALYKAARRRRVHRRQQLGLQTQ